MAKLYYTEDIEKILNEKIASLAKKCVEDKKLSDTETANVMNCIRINQAFVDEVIADMKAADEKYAKDMAEWKAARLAAEGKSNDE